MPKRFTTSCTAHNGILNGWMELDTGTGRVTRYESSTATVRGTTNSGHSPVNLNFKVEFTTGPQKYPVKAIPDGKGGWIGLGGIKGRKAAIEPWTATATELSETESKK